MALTYGTMRAALAGRRLPAAMVDLDAFDRNVDRVLAQLESSGMPLRVASKSIRSVALLRRLQERAGSRMVGTMCYAVEEAAFLAERGFDDLLVAYPCVQRRDVDLALALRRDGVVVRLMVDSSEGIDKLAGPAASSGVVLPVMLCVDMSLHLGKVHVGVWRSPLRAPGEIVELAAYIERQPALRFAGIMGYEAQVAGLADAVPFSRWLNPAKALIRRASVPRVEARRGAVVDALRAAGLPPAVVNGGGSGSLDSSCADGTLTEVTAGSAFYKPHLFDYYRNGHMRALEPACFFAIEVTRKPESRMVTCLGGGYVASGAPGLDKVPQPWLPTGLELMRDEMCGEVQTPLRVPEGADIALGDPIVMRPAKGEQLGERFNELLLLHDGEVVDCVPTYRGEGKCFF